MTWYWSVACLELGYVSGRRTAPFAWTTGTHPYMWNFICAYAWANGAVHASVCACYSHGTISSLPPTGQQRLGTSGLNDLWWCFLLQEYVLALCDCWESSYLMPGESMVLSARLWKNLIQNILSCPFWFVVDLWTKSQIRTCLAMDPLFFKSNLKFSFFLFPFADYIGLVAL